MKIRSGFVSNSSSSSYICGVCGNHKEGWDLGMYEIEFFQCENGHYFCSDHVKFEDGFDYPVISKELVLKCAKENEKYITEEYNIKLNESSIEELVDYIDGIGEGLNYDVPEKYCPVCNFNCRGTITDQNLLNYILKTRKIDDKKILKQIKNQFKTYKDFQNFVDDKNA